MRFVHTFNFNIRVLILIWKHLIEDIGQENPSSTILLPLHVLRLVRLQASVRGCRVKPEISS